MAVYVVVDNDVIDQEPYREYLKEITPTVSQYGGRYIVRAGKIHFADTNWKPDRLIIIEFDNLKQAKAWVTSEETVPIHNKRRAHAKSHLIIIDGVDEN